MPSPPPTRRRLLLALGAGTTLIAGCGDTEPTPEPAPPPETDTPVTETPGAGPDEETPPATEEIQQGTGTPVPDDVVFSKPGGGEVPATVYGSGNCGIVLVPQADRGRQSWDRYARQVSGDGYLAIAIDEGEERRDASVLGAIQYLREDREVERVVVIGASVGGEAALQGSAEMPADVDGIVALSPAGGAEAAADLDLPMLVLVSEDDGDYLATAEEIVEATPGGAELVTYDGEAHGQELLNSEHSTDVQQRIADFVTEVCYPETE